LGRQTGPKERKIREPGLQTEKTKERKRPRKGTRKANPKVHSPFGNVGARNWVCGSKFHAKKKKQEAWCTMSSQQKEHCASRKGLEKKKTSLLGEQVELYGQSSAGSRTWEKHKGRAGSGKKKKNPAHPYALTKKTKPPLTHSVVQDVPLSALQKKKAVTLESAAKKRWKGGRSRRKQNARKNSLKHQKIKQSRKREDRPKKFKSMGTQRKRCCKGGKQ